MALPSFAFGAGFDAKTPADVARNRKVYEALVQRSMPQNLGEGLNRVGEVIAAMSARGRADDAEKLGRQHAADLVSGFKDGADESEIFAALSDPWLSENPGGSLVAQTLLQRKMKESDPDTSLDRQYKAAQIAALNAKPAVTPTDDMRELAQINAERAAAGTPPLSTEEFLASKGSNGLQVVTNPDGTTSITMGGSGKPLTEAQSKDVYFINQGSQALPTIDALGDALTNLGEAVGSNVPVVGNYLKSPEYQQAEQAGRQFINALLRKESGAAVPESEDRRYGDAYLPRPGDQPPVLAQKKAARANALLGIKMGLNAPAILALQQGGVDFAKLSAEAAGEAPQGTTTQTPAGEEVVAVNPATGEKLKLVNGAWVPF